MLSLGKKKQKQIEGLCEQAEEAYYCEDFEAAEEIVLRALPLAQDIQEKDTFPLCMLVNLQAGILRKMRRDDEALAVSLAILPTFESLSEPQFFHLGGLLNNIGQLTAEKGEPAEALAFFNRAMEFKQKALEELEAQEDETGVSAYLNMGEYVEILNSKVLTYMDQVKTYDLLGDEENAAICLDQGLDLVSESGNGQWQVIYAQFLQKHGREQQATDLMEKAEIKFTDALLAPEDKYAALNPDLVTFELLKAKYKESGEIPLELFILKIRRALMDVQIGSDKADRLNPMPVLSSVYASIHGEDSLELADHYEQLGVEFHVLAQESQNLHHFKESESYYRKGLHILNKELEADHPQRLEALGNLRDLFEDTGRNPNEVEA